MNCSIHSNAFSLADPTRLPASRVKPTGHALFSGLQNSSIPSAQLTQDVLAPSVRFGQACKANSKRPESRGLMQTLRDWSLNFWGLVRQAVLGCFRSIELGYDKLKMGVTISLGLMSFLPMPHRFRQYIESKFLFGPIKASHVLLIKDRALRQKIVDPTFDMNQFRSQMERAGLPLTFPQDDVRLSVWHIKAKPGMPTVVFSHGRGGNNSHLEHVLKTFSKAGFGIIVYDYPGFGQSSGYPTEDGLNKSGLAVSLYAQKELGIPVSKQILMGTSLGSMVAADTAKRLVEHPQLCQDGKPPMALVLTSTFPALKNVFIYKRDRISNALRYIFNENKVKLKLKVQESLTTGRTGGQHVKNTSSPKPLPIPILMLQGAKDKDTPPDMALQMFNDINGTATVKHIQPSARPITLKRDQVQFTVMPNAQHKLREKDYKVITDELETFLKRQDIPLPSASAEKTA